MTKKTKPTDPTPDDAPTYPTDVDGAGMDEPRRTSDTVDLTTDPNAPTATIGHKDETYYSANPPSTDGHDETMRDQAGDPQSPQSSPSAYPDYVNMNTGAQRVATRGSTGDSAPENADSLGDGRGRLEERWKALPTQEDWESLGVGSSITRTADGWEVIRKVTSGGGFAHGAGRSITRAFQTIGAQYEPGTLKLVDAAGEPLPPETDETL